MSIPAIRTTLAFLSILAVPIGAQIPSGVFEVRYTFADGGGDDLGISVSGAGDVNQDGFDDFIIGARDADVSGLRDVGSAFVYSGRDGAEIRRFDGSDEFDLFGGSVAGAGDVNKDGVPDLIVGARGAGVANRGSAYVFSGADGSLLWRFDGALDFGWFGWAVDGAGDVNQDGHADVIVGGIADPFFERTSVAIVYSGKDGTVIWHFDDTVDESLSAFGSSVAGAGDVNQDGFADVIVGDRSARPGGLRTAGAALVYSGKDGSLLWRFDGAQEFGWFGESVDGAGDVNRDGFDDVVVGAFRSGPNDADDFGIVYVFSGKDGTTLWQFDGTNIDDNFGVSVAGVGDVNQDGFCDIMAGAHIGDYARVFSGKDGTTLWQIDPVADEDVGFSVAGAGDVNADGFPDVIEGGPFSSVAGTARVHVYEPALFSYGNGIEGSGNVVPKIGTGGEIPQVGNPTFQVQVTEALGGAPCVIAGSLVRAEDQRFGGTLYGDFLTPGAFVFFGFISTGPAGFPGVGTAMVPIPVPSEPTLIGFTTYWQGFVFDSGSPLPIGISHTDGLAVTVIQ